MPNIGSGQAEKQVAAYFAEQGDRILHHSLSEIAINCGVSEPTVVRFCRHAGYAGLKEYKIALAHKTPTSQPISAEDTLADVKQKIFTGCMESIQQSAKSLDDASLAQAVELLAEADNIDVYAAGGSTPIANYLRHQLMKLGFRTNICSDSSSMLLSQSRLSASDAVLAISCTGATSSVAEALCSARERGAATLCLTNVADSPVADGAEVVLCTEGQSVLGNNAYARLAQMAVVDTIFAALLLRQQKEQEENSLE